MVIVLKYCPESKIAAVYQRDSAATAQSLYNTTNVCHNTHINDHIVRPQGRNIGRISWVQSLIYILP